MKKKTTSPRLTLLIILDGFGLDNPKKLGNAITPETAPYIFSCMKKYASTALEASGDAVGLSSGQEGNSEAGHFNIGAGRVVEQDAVRIWRTICEGTFFKNETFKQAVHHVKKHHTAVHVMGILTDDQSAHAHPEHLYALLEYLRRQQMHRVYLHLFTDGRDSSPHAAVTFLRELRVQMKNHEKIATIIGRFYAMDRNKIWERTEAAYNAMVLGKGICTAESAEEAIAQSYNRGDTDEYICPTVITEKGHPIATIKDNDAVFFFNNRSDRARQITKAFVQPDFEKENHGAFHRQAQPKHIQFVAMTDFGPDLPGIFTAFPNPDIKNSLAAAIGIRYRQLYISETEKYAHVTYFINGGYANPINGETRELVKSPPVRSYAEKPEMNAPTLIKKILGHIENNQFDFICVNFPNADMVGHTGDFVAAKKAIAVVDAAVQTLVRAVLKRHGQAVVVADHGNAEGMINTATGEIDTEHSTNPVPFIVIRADRKKKLASGGKLADVAPTLLKLMDIPKPKEMTGHSLIHS